MISPVAPSLFDVHATRRFLASLEGATARRRRDAAVLLVANRVRRGRRVAQRLRPTLARFFASAGVEPIAEIADSAAYPVLAAEGLALFDAAAEGVGARKAARLRDQWRPLLHTLF